ncbi:histone-fold-containing protein [Coniophora puteana RWD-64-598 SS2]|uniref:Histone-fold-containing protein n=1 Tax=Coniophora puteana (strain RWD-64-598) TaxID=741705 RepID=A0A5M3N195_CONPW|nr:histone-fold-containing protein [Coniophora puteana RWD-64-598 SS2]EIW85148.1 histone-fold-containing protein [Coniophora puteana RWD-64-598 SS2]
MTNDATRALRHGGKGGGGGKVFGPGQLVRHKPKRRRTRRETYNVHIYRVLKQVHPNSGITNRAMAIMNSFVNDVFDRLANEASRLAILSKRSTISHREIQTSAKLLLPGELGRHALSEANKSVTRKSLSSSVRETF